jgi:hypothetical protein
MIRPKIANKLAPVAPVNGLINGWARMRLSRSYGRFCSRLFRSSSPPETTDKKESRAMVGGGICFLSDCYYLGYQ